MPAPTDTRTAPSLRAVVAVSERANAALYTLRKVSAQPVVAALPHHRALLDELSNGMLGAPLPIPDRRWRELGFQSDDPTRDFRAGGALALRCLAAFCRTNRAAAAAAVERHCDTARASRGVWFLFAVESIGVTCDLVQWFVDTRGAPEGTALAEWWHGCDGCTQSHLAVFQQLHDALLVEGWRRWERDQPHATRLAAWRAAWAAPQHFRRLFGTPPIPTLRTDMLQMDGRPVRRAPSVSAPRNSCSGSRERTPVTDGG